MDACLGARMADTERNILASLEANQANYLVFRYIRIL